MSDKFIKPLNKKVKKEINIPSDKSITHRAFLLSSISEGKSKIYNPLISEDTKITIDLIKKLGAKILFQNNKWEITPSKKINNFFNFYSGNSGTTARISSGILSSIKGKFKITGDVSLSKRPMKRIISPLSKMGATIKSDNDHLPMTIYGGNLRGIDYNLKIPSAQVKSSIMFAAIRADGNTTVRGAINSRNHTEMMFKNSGIDIEIKNDFININPSIPKGMSYCIPGDFSSAAFFIALGLTSNKVNLNIKNVNLNKTRTGMLDILKLMKANYKIDNYKKDLEPIGDIITEKSEMINLNLIEKDLIPFMIDEIPILALIQSQSYGKTVFKNLSELRKKETDRIKALVHNFEKIGVKIEELNDGYIIEGPQEIIGGEVDSFNDHRIAMTFAIAGLISQDGIKIKNSNCVDVSFPGFFNIIEDLYS
ncbi:MAG: 3-phosphoshikimate 1-carboxyvinyltransferase [Thermotogota bacterium]